MEINETKTIYICVDCKMKLKGLMNVRRHCSIHKHYSFKNPKTKGVIGFV